MLARLLLVTVDIDVDGAWEILHVEQFWPLLAALAHQAYHTSTS